MNEAARGKGGRRRGRARRRSPFCPPMRDGSVDAGAPRRANSGHHPAWEKLCDFFDLGLIAARCYVRDVVEEPLSGRTHRSSSSESTLFPWPNRKVTAQAFHALATALNSWHARVKFAPLNALRRHPNRAQAAARDRLRAACKTFVDSYRPFKACRLKLHGRAIWDPGPYLSAIALFRQCADDDPDVPDLDREDPNEMLQCCKVCNINGLPPLRGPSRPPPSKKSRARIFNNCKDESCDRFWRCQQANWPWSSGH